MRCDAPATLMVCCAGTLSGHQKRSHLQRMTTEGDWTYPLRVNYPGHQRASRKQTCRHTAVRKADNRRLRLAQTRQCPGTSIPSLLQAVQERRAQPSSKWQPLRQMLGSRCALGAHDAMPQLAAAVPRARIPLVPDICTKVRLTAACRGIATITRLLHTL